MLTTRVKRLLYSLTLLTILVALTPLAYATPPDPTWTPGLFDEDDSDYGIFLITSSQAALSPFPGRGWTGLTLSGPAIVLDDQASVASRYASSAHPRAPPLS